MQTFIVALAGRGVPVFLENLMTPAFTDGALASVDFRSLLGPRCRRRRSPATCRWPRSPGAPRSA